MKHNKHWILRPIAWIFTLLTFLLLQLAADLICLLGEYITYKLSGLSTITIVILAMSFGSFLVGTFFYSIVYLTALFVELSDRIYPSNHAFRYYFIGIYEIIGCAYWVFAAIIGSVTGGSLFWYYARYVWLILASVGMMLFGRNAANERHR